MKRQSAQPLATSHWFLPISVLFITLLTYLPTCNYPFQFDDLGNITKNFNIRHFNGWEAILSYRRWVGELLNSLIFRLDGFAPFYYRLCNIAIHLASGALVFALITWLCKRTATDAITYRQRHAIAGVTSALFLLHPVQSQTVSYAIQGKLEGLASMLLLISLLCMVRVLTHKTQRALPCIGGLLAALIACGTKEIAFVAPALLLLVDWFFIARQDWKSLQSRLLWHLAYGGIIGVVMIQYFKPSFFMTAFKLGITLPNNRGNVLTNAMNTAITPLSFFISQFKVLIHYLWMFVWPAGISVDYDWKLSEHLFQTDTLYSLVFVIGLIGGSLTKTIRTHFPVVSFGLLWFFICMAPRTTIIPSQELVADYKTYLASIGWLFILSVALIALVQKMYTLYLKTEHASLAYYSFLYLGCFGLAGSTYQRNLVWSSPVAFWDDVTQKAPHKARGFNNLAVELVHEGSTQKRHGNFEVAEAMYARAEKAYKHAMQLDSEYPDPLSNLSVLYTMQDKIDDAIQIAHKAIQLFPYYPEAHLNLGTQLLAKKDFEHAEISFQNAIKCLDHYGKAYYNLARCYEQQGKNEEALEALKNATQADFDSVPQSWLALGQLSLRMGKHDEAISALEKYRTIDAEPTADRWTLGTMHLANAYHLESNYEKAAGLYHELTRINPNDTRYWHNLAECFYATDQFENAQKCFARATQCGHCEVQTLLRLAQSYEKLENFEEAANTISTIIHADNSDQFPDGLLQKCRAELMRINTAKIIAQQQTA